jgi:hypothetical protein
MAWSSTSQQLVSYRRLVFEHGFVYNRFSLGNSMLTVFPVILVAEHCTSGIVFRDFHPRVVPGAAFLCERKALIPQLPTCADSINTFCRLPSLNLHHLTIKALTNRPGGLCYLCLIKLCSLRCDRGVKVARFTVDKSRNPAHCRPRRGSRTDLET